MIYIFKKIIGRYFSWRDILEIYLFWWVNEFIQCVILVFQSWFWDFYRIFFSMINFLSLFDFNLEFIFFVSLNDFSHFIEFLRRLIWIISFNHHLIRVWIHNLINEIKVLFRWLVIIWFILLVYNQPTRKIYLFRLLTINFKNLLLFFFYLLIFVLRFFPSRNYFDFKLLNFLFIFQINYLTFLCIFL